jgi:hypothetical protein
MTVDKPTLSVVIEQGQAVRLSPHDGFKPHHTKSVQPRVNDNRGTSLVRNRTFSRESDARHQFSPQNGVLDSILPQNFIFSAGVKPRKIYTNSVSVRFRTNLVLPPVWNGRAT